MRAEGYRERAAVDAARGTGAPFLRGRGLADGRSRAVARRPRAADRRLRQAAVRIYLGAFGDAGHAFPMLALGEALVARGHAVALQTWRNWEEHATAGGMTFAAAPEYQVFPTRERPLAPYAAAVRAARETVPSVRDFGPDVVVADILTVAPALAAELCDVPAATVVPHVFPWSAPGNPPFAVGARRPRTPLGRARLARVRPRRRARAGARPRRVQRLPRAARAAAARPAPHRALARAHARRHPAPARVSARLAGVDADHGSAALGAARRARRPAAGRRAGDPRRPLDRTGSRPTGCCAPRSRGSRARRSA